MQMIGMQDIALHLVIGQIPQTVLEEYRATMQQGRDKGWVESEWVLVVLRGNVVLIDASIPFAL